LNYPSSANCEIDYLNGKSRVIKFSKMKDNRFMQKYNPSVYNEFLNLNLIHDEANGDIRNIEINRKYDVIIISDVIHFFKPKIRLEIVEKLKRALSDKGLIYISANTSERMPKFHEDFELKTNKLDHKTYQSKENLEYIYYLLDETDFKKITEIFSKTHWFNDSNKPNRLNEIVICEK